MTPEQAELLTLTQQIAFFLNEGCKTPVWKPKENTTADGELYQVQYIVDNEEREISIHIERYGSKKNRVEVWGNFHLRNWKGEIEFIDVRQYIPFAQRINSGWDYTALPSISVAKDRGSQIIAREIKKRFLPEYEKMYQKAIEKRNAAIEYHKGIDEKLSELCEIVNIKLEERRSTKYGREITNKVTFDYKNVSGYFEVFEDSVTIKFDNVSMLKATQLLTIALNS